MPQEHGAVWAQTAGIHSGFLPFKIIGSSGGGEDKKQTNVTSDSLKFVFIIVSLLGIRRDGQRFVCFVLIIVIRDGLSARV